MWSITFMLSCLFQNVNIPPTEFGSDWTIPSLWKFQFWSILWLLRPSSSLEFHYFAIKNCVILQADEAFHIGAAASRESYLKMEKIIEVAIQSGAQVKKDCPHLHLNLICVKLYRIREGVRNITDTTPPPPPHPLPLCATHHYTMWLVQK